jgi:hypothetical protein
VADYTPTTEAVRYVYAGVGKLPASMTNERLEEFDRWLASVLAEQSDWEYGVYDPATNDVDECGPGPVTRDSFTGIDWDVTGEFIVRRRPAGPWLPAEEYKPENTDGSER